MHAVAQMLNLETGALDLLDDAVAGKPLHVVAVPLLEIAGEMQLPQQPEQRARLTFTGHERVKHTARLQDSMRLGNRPPRPVARDMLQNIEQNDDVEAARRIRQCR